MAFGTVMGGHGLPDTVWYCVQTTLVPNDLLSELLSELSSSRKMNVQLDFGWVVNLASQEHFPFCPRMLWKFVWAHCPGAR